MFDSLSEKLQAVFDKLRGRGRLNEQDVAEAMREVRLALLEADVNFKVVKDFVNKVKEKSVGQDILDSLTPDQHVIKIVRDELVELLGVETPDFRWKQDGITVILLCGLQGSGKTTSSAKMAKYFQRNGKKPMLVAADVQRPAAIKQLQVLGEQIDTPVFTSPLGTKPPQIVKDAYKAAQQMGIDVLILDTAGRLQTDTALMSELREIRNISQPDETLLVLDSTTGQTAVNVAQTFHEHLNLTGVVLTKMDSDTRGGAALSIRAVTGAPVRFIGVGEKTEALELFYPDRMAGRILGMGDVLSLIERAEQTLDKDKAIELEQKIRNNSFNFEDMLSQMQQIKKLGPLQQILGMIPGLGIIKDKINEDEAAQQMKRTEAIIFSMTIEERRNPELLNGHRKRRIASGSGTTVYEINTLIKQMSQMREMMKTLKGGKMNKKLTHMMNKYQQ